MANRARAAGPDARRGASRFNWPNNGRPWEEISVILGKRSKDLTGTAYAEIASGRQELRTAYEARKVEHSDVQAKADRDEIPQEFQGYVEHYFLEMRKADPRVARAAKRH